MRITRFVDEHGSVRLGRELADGTAEVLHGDPFNRLRPSGVQARVQQRLAPIDPVNIFCIGLNYREHAAETATAVPEHPVVFMKPTSAINHPGGPIRLPACCDSGPEVDYEGELAVVIGRTARNIPEQAALDFVLGYTCANDVSARRWQKQRGGGQWVRGKGFDTFCPLGPVLVTADEIDDPQQLGLRTTVNGQVLQDGNTADMIHPVAALIGFLSQDTTLLPGTVILTGTPSGVGAARKPPRFLRDGDEVAVEIGGIGKLSNHVVRSCATR